MATVTSKQFRLDWRDLLHGAFVAVGTSVLPPIMEVINSGSLEFDWKKIGQFAMAGFIGYIIKKFLTPTQIVITPASNEQADAVKEGDAVVKVVTK